MDWFLYNGASNRLRKRCKKEFFMLLSNPVKNVTKFHKTLSLKTSSVKRHLRDCNTYVNK